MKLKTINGTIAKEIDKAGKPRPTFSLSEKSSETRIRQKPAEGRIDGWRAELLAVIKTDVGKSILQKLDRMLQVDAAK
jgi:hypothetical protein